MNTLDNLKINQTGKVSNINCNSMHLKRRFSDLGIIKNTDIKPVYKSISGDPIAYEIRGSIIAIRKEDAHNIEIY